MRELQEDTFSGNKNVDRILDIVSLFNILGVTQYAVMLRVFRITLIGAAKRWVEKLSPGTVDSWDLLKKSFIQRYCPPSKTVTQLKKSVTSSRKQKKHYTKPGKGIMTCFTNAKLTTSIAIRRNIVSSSNTEGITAIVNKLDSLGRDMKKLKENVHAIQVGCQLYGGAHLDKECPLNKEVKSVKEVKYGEFGCSSPFSDGKYRVGMPGYYTCIDNRPLFGEKRPSLEELMSKHLEDSI
ncbi:hypothetical protein Tco_1156469 [Tanacetum coccineum]